MRRIQSVPHKTKKQGRTMPSPKNSIAAVDITEFRQNWRILILSVIGIAISINASLLYGFGTLVVPLEEAFGWERIEP